MICVTGQLLRCLSTPWKTGPGWRVFIAQWRQPSQPHDRGLGRKRRQRRERRKATGRGSPLFGCCLAAVLRTCMYGWLAAACILDCEWECERECEWEEAPSAAPKGSSHCSSSPLPRTACRPCRNCNHGFIGGRPWSGSDRVTSRRKPLSTARLSWPHRLLGAPMWCNNQYLIIVARPHESLQLGEELPLADSLTGPASSAVRYGKATIWSINLSPARIVHVPGGCRLLWTHTFVESGTPPAAV
jgi:hypothetical protein